MKEKDHYRLSNLTKISENTLKFESQSLKTKRIFQKKVSSIVGDFTFLMFKVTGYIPCHIVRNFLYKNIFKMKIGRNTVIYFGLEARCPWNIIIGNNSIIGDHAILDARYGIYIGDNVNLSTGVWMWTLQHDVNAEDFTTSGQEGSIYVGNRAWISSRTVLLPGISIAEGVVVASGAVVTKSIKTSFSIWGGVPAKIIGKRNEHLNYEFDGNHRAFL